MELSLILRLAIVILVLVTAATSVPATKVNLTAVFDQRLIRLLRQTSSALSLNKKTDRDLKVILNELEVQNAKPGDACDRMMWTDYMKPIYEALLQDNYIVQKSKNDDFAVAILKDKSVMTKVCMSSTEVLECNPKGKCDCLTILPKDLEAEFPCGTTTMTADAGGGILGLILQNPVFLWARQVFGGGASGSPPTTSISASILAVLAISSLASLVL